MLSRIRRFWALVRLVVGLIAVIDPDIILGAFALPPEFRNPLRLAAGYLLFGEVFAAVATLDAGHNLCEFLIGYDFISKTESQADSVERPKLRVQNRLTLVQVLIGIAGVMVAFGGRQGATNSTQPSLTFLLASILLGVLYMFVLGGAIGEDTTQDGKAVVTMSSLHEGVLEILLNLEVVSLVLGSAVFFSTGPTP